MEQNDYQYFCVLEEGGYFMDSFPMLVIPGSYIYFNKKRFYVAEYREPIGEDANEYDVQVYCIEDRTTTLKALKREFKINEILKKND